MNVLPSLGIPMMDRKCWILYEHAHVHVHVICYPARPGLTRKIGTEGNLLWAWILLSNGNLRLCMAVPSYNYKIRGKTNH